MLTAQSELNKTKRNISFMYIYFTGSETRAALHRALLPAFLSRVTGSVAEPSRLSLQQSLAVRAREEASFRRDVNRERVG